jgi:hypothetical protein
MQRVDFAATADDSLRRSVDLFGQNWDSLKRNKEIDLWSPG